MAVDKKTKAIVEAILQKKGIDYDDWLNKKHLEFIMENSDYVLSALNIKEGN